MFLITTSRVLLSSVVGLNYDLGIDVTVALGFRYWSGPRRTCLFYILGGICGFVPDFDCY